MNVINFENPKSCFIYFSVGRLSEEKSKLAIVLTKDKNSKVIVDKKITYIDNGELGFNQYSVGLRALYHTLNYVKELRALYKTINIGIQNQVLFEWISNKEAKEDYSEDFDSCINLLEELSNGSTKIVLHLISKNENIAKKFSKCNVNDSFQVKQKEFVYIANNSRQNKSVSIKLR